MEEKEILEFLTILHLEDKANKNIEFYHYMEDNTNIKNFNIRYSELLDKFLNLYAS